jgi:hypothetical protein
MMIYRVIWAPNLKESNVFHAIIGNIWKVPISLVFSADLVVDERPEPVSLPSLEGGTG